MAVELTRTAARRRSCKRFRRRGGVASWLPDVLVRRLARFDFHFSSERTHFMTKSGSVANYSEPSDMALFAPELIASAPAEAQAFLAFKNISERSDGVIPAKYRELIALGVALTTQCSYCLDVHTRQALEAGATREELGETVFIAAALRAGAAVGHGMLVQKIADAVGKPASPSCHGAVAERRRV